MGIKGGLINHLLPSQAGKETKQNGTARNQWVWYHKVSFSRKNIFQKIKKGKKRSREKAKR
jgi:hypothetical protein